MSNPTAPTAKATTPDDIAPPALPGASGVPGLATAPVLRKAITGDPTTALFVAINNSDYNAAQDAISRGANTDAQNDLGETPLDLSVALNRNSITFLLLSARNESGETGAAPAPMPMAMTQPAPAVPGRAVHHPLHTKSGHIATVSASVAPPPMNAPPNPGAGFLGFGPSN